ncbi:hypothetical protein ABPG72_006374 [Tetrahymena utriculariae]
MGERLVKTEVGEKICQQIADELSKQQLESSQLRTARHQKSFTDNSEDMIKKYDINRKLIQSINSSRPQEKIIQNNNFENSWGVESSIQIMHAAQNELIKKCKDQHSIIQYFQDKNLWTPYIQQKVKATSQKIIPQLNLKNKNYQLRNSIKVNDSSLNQSQEQLLKSSQNYYFSKFQQDHVINPNAISTQFSNSSTQKDATSRIYERLKNIQSIKKELMGQKAQQLAHLEQKIEQLNLRQSQYEQQRLKINDQIQNKMSDVKSYVYKPPTLEEMKKKNDPSQIMKYNEQSGKINYKLAIAKIHQRKYSENWKKLSEQKELINQNNSQKIDVKYNLSQGFNTKLTQQSNTKVSFFMPSLSKSISQNSKLTQKYIK